MDSAALIMQKPLDQADPLPLYRQLKQRITQLIAMGTLCPGDALPPEESLCSALGISRSTVRRCFRDLVDEGHVTRRRGRGTVVAAADGGRAPDTLYTQVSTGAAIARSGARPGSRLLRVRSMPASNSVAKLLALQPGTAVWEVNRLRLASGEPVIHELAYAPSALCPNLAKADFSRSLYQYIAEASGVIMGATDEFLDPVVLDRQEARLLRAAPGSAGIRATITSYDAAGVPFETSVGIARADRFRMEIRYAAEGSRFWKKLG